MEDGKEIAALLKHNLDSILETAKKVRVGNPVSGWNGLEILEHLYIIERNTYKFFSTAAEGTDPLPLVHGNSKLHHMLVNRMDVKVEAPGFAVPQGRFDNLESALNLFTENRLALIELQENKAVALEKTGWQHPRLGFLNGQEWGYFIAQHAERHRIQWSLIC